MNPKVLGARKVRAGIELALTVLLALCALVVTGSIVRREIFDRQSRGQTEATVVKNWTDYATEREWRGAQSPSTRIVVFSDFQCPYCAQLSRTLDSLLSAYPDEVAWQYRHFPITLLHAQAFEAAVASECSRAQGRFNAFHDELFKAPASIGRVPWRHFGVEAGVPDLEEFERCISRMEFSDLVRADSVAATSLNAGGTPTVLVNQWRFAGAPTLAQLIEIVKTESGRDK